MSNLFKALDLRKENGMLSEAFLMRKLKIPFAEAATLIKDVEELIQKQESEHSENKVKHLEIHIKAEYDK